MQKLTTPSIVRGSVRAPASKSYMQRAIAAALLSEGQTTTILNPSGCDDVVAALSVAERLGATVERREDLVRIGGRFAPRDSTLHCGEAGLCIRLFASIAALHDGTLTMTGEGSLNKRPLDTLQAPLRALGASCDTVGGFAPVTVCGPLRGGTAHVCGKIGSQMLSGLLFALPRAENDSTLEVEGLQSTPYIDMTIHTLQDFGVTVAHEEYREFRIPGNQRYQSPGEYRVEGDWSGASFHLVAGAVAGSVTVEGLNPSSLQADRDIMDALALAGAKIEVMANAVSIAQASLAAFDFHAGNCPDLFPPLVALAAHCDGVSTIRGALRLTHKESNRALVLQREFGKLGIRVDVDGDVMQVHGGTVTGGTIDACGDHRIAMAGAVAALAAKGAVTVTGAECVDKSYPEFHDDLATLLA
ncbi:MAG: 3-phosphoshikimate 1-carboxyvinyltransferase [Lentisphaeria bacterium]|nr:3-phosphoshikimate 1-carboxyvinyltransferase [Lentisphaeria bacterium]